MKKIFSLAVLVAIAISASAASSGSWPTTATDVSKYPSWPVAKYPGAPKYPDAPKFPKYPYSTANPVCSWPEA